MILERLAENNAVCNPKLNRAENGTEVEACEKEITRSEARDDSTMRPTGPFFSIPELAVRWRCSRGSVYNRIRGEMVVDFAAKGRKGHKLIPVDVVLKLERAHLRVLR